MSRISVFLIAAGAIMRYAIKVSSAGSTRTRSG